MKKVFPIIVLLMSMICLSAQEVDVKKFSNPTYVILEREADMLYLNADYKGASEKILAALQQNMDDGNLYFKLSRCYAKLLKPRLAADFLVIAINNGFNDYKLIREEKAYERIRNNVHFKSTYEEVLEYGMNLGDEIYFVSVEKKIKCRIFYPDNYDPEKSYPLIIGLHGYGSSTEDFALIFENFPQRNFIFVIPEAPYTVRLVGIKIPQYSWSMPTRDLDLLEQADQSTFKYITDLSIYFKEKFNPSKTILMGFSQGTAYTYRIALKHPHLYDGLICFAGVLPYSKEYRNFITDEEFKNAKDLEIFISHGEFDRIDVKYSKTAFKKFKKNGYKVELDITPIEHIITHDGFLAALKWHGIF